MSNAPQHATEHRADFGGQMNYELRHDTKQLCQDLMVYFKEYARENPETVALWSFGIGFIVGWKLKPW